MCKMIHQPLCYFYLRLCQRKEYLIACRFRPVLAVDEMAIANFYSLYCLQTTTKQANEFNGVKAEHLTRQILRQDLVQEVFQQADDCACIAGNVSGVDQSENTF